MNNSRKNKNTLHSFFTNPTSTSVSNAQNKYPIETLQADPQLNQIDVTDTRPTKRIKNIAGKKLDFLSSPSSCDGSRFEPCPICNRSFPIYFLQEHAEFCHIDEHGKYTDDKISSNVKKSKNCSSRFSPCPVCGQLFPLHKLNEHTLRCIDQVDENNSELYLKATIKEDENKEEFIDSISHNNHIDKLLFNTSPDDTVAIEKDKNHSPPIDSQSDKSFCISPSSKHQNKEDSKPTNKDISTLSWDEILKREPIKENESVDNPIQHTSEPIPGLYIYENFITEEEEKRIIDSIEGKVSVLNNVQQGSTNTTLNLNDVCDYLPWRLTTWNGKQRGKRWGVHCNLIDRQVYKHERPLPNFIYNDLMPKLKRLVPMKGCTPNEANAIDYIKKEGHYLKSHVDDRKLSLEPIANLSLAGDCYMTYINERMENSSYLFANRHLPPMVKVLLKRRTLQVLTGKARYDYSHGITNDDILSERRISLTMRESPMTCNKNG